MERLFQVIKNDNTVKGTFNSNTKIGNMYYIRNNTHDPYWGNIESLIGKFNPDKNDKIVELIINSNNTTNVINVDYNSLVCYALKIESFLGYRLSEVLFLKNPLDRAIPTNPISKDIDNLEKWIQLQNEQNIENNSIRKLIEYSIFNSKTPNWINVFKTTLDTFTYRYQDNLIDSVWNTVNWSILNKFNYQDGCTLSFKIKASIIDAIYAYIGSIFPLVVMGNLNEENKYKYQCIVELWNRGLFPSFKGDVWQLQSSNNGKIVHIN